MKFSEIIESFDSQHAATVEKNTPYRYDLSTVIGNKKILFSANRFLSVLDGKTPAWEIVFSEINDKGFEKFDKTNTGYEMQVFSFVIDCVRKFINDKNPEVIEFSASGKEGNRERLYNKLASRIKVAGYEFKGTHRGTEDTYFVFSKSNK